MYFSTIKPHHFGLLFNYSASAYTYACTLYSNVHVLFIYLLELDRWIVSRLAVAVRTCESAWPLFDFPTITSAIYNFWLYELCDYYIEYAKPFVLTREVQGNSAAKVLLFNNLPIVIPHFWSTRTSTRLHTCTSISSSVLYWYPYSYM